MRIFFGKQLQKCCFNNKHLTLFCKMCVLAKIIATVLATTVYQLAFICLGFCNGSILMFIMYFFTRDVSDSIDSIGTITKISFLTLVAVTIIFSAIFLVKKTPSKPVNYVLVFLNILDIIAMCYSLYIFLDEFEPLDLIKVVNILFSGITIFLLIKTSKASVGIE